MSLKKTITDAISTDRVKDILVELVKVPSPQTDKFESEPLLAEFIRNAVEPRLRKMGITDIRYDKMDNLISTYGADTTRANR